MTSCPKRLFDIQKWFAEIITRPLEENQTLPSLSPHGNPMAEEVGKKIAPSPTLKPHQRIEIYSQQYWWRLIQILQENFPLVTRLFGYKEFNKQIAIPYLNAHPPTHWALCRLGDTLPHWIEHNYDKKNKDLVLNGAQIDFAAQIAFWSGSSPPFTPETDPQELLSLSLTLQPTSSLFKFPYELFSFRDALLENEPDHYLIHPLPTLEQGDFYFLVYRNVNNQVRWKTLSEGEYRLLTLLQTGTTIQTACATLEKEGGDVYKEATELIPLWFKQWITNNLLTIQVDVNLKIKGAKQ